MVLPTGTVTFLFADVEDGSRLIEEQPEAMRLALAFYHARMQTVVQAHHGDVFKTVRDVCCCVFATATDAVAAALDMQKSFYPGGNGETQTDEPSGGAAGRTESLTQHPDSLHLPPTEASIGPMRIRIALNTGPAEQRENDYFGTSLNRVARLLAIAHGGQIVLARTTAELARDLMPPQTGLIDLGEHRLRDLNRPEQVFQLTSPGLSVEFPPLRSLDSPDLPNNLPRQLTSFVGRDRQIAEIKALFLAKVDSPKSKIQNAEVRLLTLIGSGGCGKTRLALQVAADLLDHYPDGVWLVELAGLIDPEMAPQAIAAALHLREVTGKPVVQALIEQLRHRRLLLVLDGCEHLLSGCARLAHALIRSCSDLHLLITSRESLGIQGETLYRVPSLTLPDVKPHTSSEYGAQCESVRLFVDRAHLCKPDFVLTERNLPLLAQVCRRLDGIPLAIELAAARLRALSLEQISARLDDRFRLLTGGSRTALPRHQTLRALIDWSYDYLSDLEKTLLCRLSVFAGGFTLDAAEAICTLQAPLSSPQEAASTQPGNGAARLEGSRDALSTFMHTLLPEDVLDLLTGLLDKSLVLYESEMGGERYRLLETVRQYARERLTERGETQRLRGQHAAWYLHFAEEATHRTSGAEQARWMDRLEDEHDNLRAALAWGLEQHEDPSLSLRLAGTLAKFWKLRGYWSEGRGYLTAALARSGGDTALSARASALYGAGEFAGSQGDAEAALELLQEGLGLYEALEDRYGVGMALNALGLVASGHGEYVKARSLWEQALQINRSLGARTDQAINLGNLGAAAHAMGDYVNATRLYEEALALNRQLGDPAGQAICLHSLGGIAYAQGRPERTIVLMEQALEINQLIGNRSDQAWNLNMLASIAMDQGDAALAEARLAQALQIACAIGDRACEAWNRCTLGNVASSRGDWIRARTEYTLALEISRKIGDASGEAAASRYLSNALREQGELGQAQQLGLHSLRLFYELGMRGDLPESLESLASLSAVRNEAERAVRLQAAAAAQRQLLGTPLSSTMGEAMDHQIDRLRGVLGENAFRGAWEQGQNSTLEEAIVFALSPLTIVDTRSDVSS